MVNLDQLQKLAQHLTMKSRELFAQSHNVPWKDFDQLQCTGVLCLLLKAAEAKHPIAMELISDLIERSE
jgi:hypothetical protein